MHAPTVSSLNFRSSWEIYAWFSFHAFRPVSAQVKSNNIPVWDGQSGQHFTHFPTPKIITVLTLINLTPPTLWNNLICIRDDHQTTWTDEARSNNLTDINRCADRSCNQVGEAIGKHIRSIELPEISKSSTESSLPFLIALENVFFCIA